MENGKIGPTLVVTADRIKGFGVPFILDVLTRVEGGRW